ncbi:MAG: TldD/PmbA family protein [Opitutaceae bacterium]|nr:TldD/PmbA family protein [Opitutaceae bacterium]
MTHITRRSFVSATAKGAAVIAAGSWLGARALAAPAAGGEAGGYFAREFGIGDELCRKVLARALARGGDFAELFFEHTLSTWVSLEDGKVNRASGDVALGVGIRTVKGDQVGYGFTQELTLDAMLGAASIAASIADAGAGKVAGAFSAPPLGSFYLLDQPLSTTPLASKVALVQDLNNRCFARSPLVAKVSATWHDQERRILVVTSDGARTEDLQPRTYLMATATAEKDGRRERANWSYGGRREFAAYTPAVLDEIASVSVDRAVTLFDAVKPPAGEMPVVLGNGVTGVLLHEAIGHGMEADFNRKNESTYSTMIGKTVADETVTIVDDGTNPHVGGSLNVDDEGVPGQRTVLVERGILIGYLHDRISARHYGVAPTGNGRRESYQHVVQPRMRNTYMLGGPSTPDEVIRSVKRGIYVEAVGNGQVKIGEGDFAFFVTTGRLIEDGKLTAPIKDVNIMGNGPRMLTNVSMVANDFVLHPGGPGACGKGGQAVPVSFGQPTILVQSLTVGGSKA